MGTMNTACCSKQSTWQFGLAPIKPLQYSADMQARSALTAAQPLSIHNDKEKKP
jgi:hypothetical protein